MDYMLRALELARIAAGRVSPNPAVGAVLVKDGKVVGEGFTQPPGQAHAEIMALRQAGDAARGGIMYVSLEPCCFHGRTPPCTQALVAAGLAEIHIATLDPNPLVAGQGLVKLEQAGIRTLVGEHEEEAVEQNEAFFKWIVTRRPFIIAKYAMTLDGKIASREGDSRWVSGEEARCHVHFLRDVVDAIMVGVGTVILDDPQLNTRLPDELVRRPRDDRQPLRVVVDSRGRIPLSSRVLDQNTGGRTVIFTTEAMEESLRQAIVEKGGEVIVAPSHQGYVDITYALEALGERPVTSLLVEGGGRLLGSFFDGKLIDKVIVFIAPKMVGGLQAPCPIGGEGFQMMSQAVPLEKVSVEQLGLDLLVKGYPRW